MKAKGFYPEDLIPCEICKIKAINIHHINFKGMGGKKKNIDDAENLIALCDFHHRLAHSNKHEFLKLITLI